MALGQNELFYLSVLDRKTETYCWKANCTAEIHMAVSPLTDSKSRHMSQSYYHTYRFDVSVCKGPLSSQEDVSELFKEILRAAESVRMPELKSVDWKIAPSTNCMTRVLK